jgi:CBS domain-containing protein
MSAAITNIHRATVSNAITVPHLAAEALKEAIAVMPINKLRAGNLMTRDVATVHPNDTAQFAARMMRDHDCGAIPVIERQGRIIGMVTDRDITVRLVASGADIRFAQVQDCMTDEVFACHVDDSLESCMRQMSQHQIRRLPVVDNYDRIVGIISQSDLAQYAEDHQDRRGGFTDMIAEVSERSKDSYR